MRVFYNETMILVAGSANLDFVVRAPHIPAPGETVLGNDFRTFAGGKGANQAIAVARSGGVATSLLLALGQDSFAEPIEASLNAAGVKLHVLRTKNLPTGAAFICVSDDAENAITVAPGANNALLPEHLPSLDGVDYLLLQLETPLATVVAYAKAARQAGVKVVLNAAPAQALPSELLASIDVLIVNEDELATVSNCAGSVAHCFAQLSDVPCLIVTLGGKGCCARWMGEVSGSVNARVSNRIIFQPAFSITPVDTTAAGDTFCGVLVAGLAQQLALPKALARASAAAALACQRPGAQDSMPTRAEVDQFLSNQPVDSLAQVAAANACAALSKYAGFTS